MSARATPLDVSALTVGGVSYLALADSVQLAKPVVTSDGRAINRKFSSPQAVKSGPWSLTFSAYITKTAPFPVTNLDLTDVSIGGTDRTAEVESLTINLACQHVNGDACEDAWAYPVYTGSTLTGSATLKVPATSVPMMAALDAPSDADMAFTFTLNGNTVTFPIIVTSVTHESTVGNVQMVRVEFEGQDGLTGDFPTAPTGTTTIFEKVMNAPQTALAATFTSKASGGVAYSGNVLIQSYSLTINNSAVVKENFTWAGVGAVTDAATV